MSIVGYAAETACSVTEPEPSTIESTMNVHWKSAAAQVTMRASTIAATRRWPPARTSNITSPTAQSG